MHVHHQVFGIMLMIAAGCLQFAYAPNGAAADALAALFGASAALTLDEFALWLRLDDVYWRAEGRSSVDAVFIAILVTGLLLSDFTPLGLGDLRNGINWEVSLFVVVNLGCVLVAIYKGKPVIGALGMMVPLIALAAAMAIMPGSSDSAPAPRAAWSDDQGRRADPGPLTWRWGRKRIAACEG